MTESTISRLSKYIDLESAVLLGGDGAGGTNGLAVLVLEDEPLISMDLEATLIDAGFDVHCAVSCKEANDLLDRHQPDVAIVDIFLQGGRCTEFVCRLLQARIPFIVHSGDRRSAQISTPFAFGPWLAKPSSPNALIKTVCAVVVAKSGLAGPLGAGEFEARWVCRRPFSLSYAANVGASSIS